MSEPNDDGRRRKKPDELYEMLRQLPDTKVGEIVEGAIWASPRPSFAHSMASSVLGAELIGPFQQGRGGPGGWWILIEPELHLGDDVVVPDLAGWRKARMPFLPSEPFGRIAPDWICEVLSPSTSTLDRIRKLPVYAREGVGWAWLIDPAGRSIEVYRLEEGSWVLAAGHAGSVRVRLEPFTAVELDLELLWAGRPPGVDGDSL